MSASIGLSDPPAVSHRPAMVPSHGRGQLRPFQPGESGNVGGQPNPLRLVQRYARKKSMPSVEALGKIVDEFNAPERYDEDGKLLPRIDHDPRVVIVAAQTILTWAFGKPPDYDPNADRPPMIVDLSKLSAQQLSLIKTMIDSGAIRPAEEAVTSTVDTSASEPET